MSLTDKDLLIDDYIPKKSNLFLASKKNSIPENLENFNFPIDFKPNLFQLTRRIYKDCSFKIKSSEILPNINLNQKILKKNEEFYNKGKEKIAFFYGNQIKITSKNPTYNLKEISFCVEELFETKSIQISSLPIYIFYQNIDSQLISFKEIIISQKNECISGLSSYEFLDINELQSFPLDLSLKNIKNNELISKINCLDLLYLYNFRIFFFSNQCDLDSYIYYPNINFEFKQMSQPLKLVSTPLTNILTQKNNKDSSNSSILTNSYSNQNYNNQESIKFGFLTLDQNQRICPLLASDPIIFQIPIIGVWIYGIYIQNEYNNFNENYKIWSVAFEFIKNKKILKKFSFDSSKKNFLFVGFNFNENPKFFDVKILDEENQWVFFKNNENNKNYQNFNIKIDDGIFFKNFIEFDKYYYNSYKNFEKEKKEKIKNIKLDPHNLKSHSVHMIPGIKNLERNRKNSEYNNHNNDHMPFKVPKPEKIPKLDEINNFTSPRFMENKIEFEENIEEKKIDKDKIIDEQANQLKELQKQILELQSALYKSQLIQNSNTSVKIDSNINTPINFNKKNENNFGFEFHKEIMISSFKSPIEGDSFTDRKKEEIILDIENSQRIFQEKRYSNQSTNTTFVIPKKNELIIDKSSSSKNDKSLNISENFQINNNFIENKNFNGDYSQNLHKIDINLNNEENKNSLEFEKKNSELQIQNKKDLEILNEKIDIQNEASIYFKNLKEEKNEKKNEEKKLKKKHKENYILNTNFLDSNKKSNKKQSLHINDDKNDNKENEEIKNINVKGSISIPQIKYDINSHSSGSSEDEEIKKIEKKYLFKK